MCWPYEQLESEDVDYTNDEINDITKSRALTEDTGITILGRGVKRPTDENLKFPPQPLQGTARRRLRLLINEWWGRSCIITDGKKDKVSTSSSLHHFFFFNFNFYKPFHQGPPSW